MEQQRAIIVTGASRGLGFELVDLLIAADAKPIALGRGLDPRHEAAAGMNTCIFVAADLSVSQSLDQIDLARALPQSADEIVVISNAGVIEPIGTLDVIDSASLAAAFAVNALAPAILARKLLAAADARRSRLRILNISTGAARRPLPGLGAYCASKAAALMIFDCLATERPDVAIEHIDPGVLDTDMQSTLRGADDQALPVRQMFASFETEAKLRRPRDVAREILVGAGLL
ncbi:SDR family NAD(P)-dependent oxidoreductase [Bradyrhizobium sp. KB893862 SZCCT0404]|uniref:SDR family NAD(P)-dependent oxidoreductase n=1 Tax=Bradyrhizobium sp. KB893862 SZCCT0404 TaxID=2807672 RepID=UPI001BA9CC5C|nr:SDR family NAD(P)-dependent oxidoreductase [Bradyrhizobium sp. KB893862 SZCCT0404]MBR1174232.1 SDR family NAD(P)-dependent oxidoreductase [Bradyrhizobium sp. KB893862 SZCCT0404]